MPLQPSRVKFRKQQRGWMRGIATRGSSLAFGEYGLKALDCHWLTGVQIEAARVLDATDPGRARAYIA